MRLKRTLCLLAICVSSNVGIMAQDQRAGIIANDPEVRIGKLANGLTYYIQHNNEPANQAEFYIAQKVGSILEEENQRGLAHFLEHMCFNGTKNFPGNTSISYLESIGVKFGENLNAYTSVDQTVYNISNVPILREGIIDSCLLILHDWSHNLTLDKKEIDKERGVIHEEWRMRSSPELRIFERTLPLLYPNSKYGNRMPIGLMSVVDNFKPKALRDYYEKWYRPDLQAIIVVGNVDVDKIEAKIKATFADIKAQKNPAPRIYTEVPDTKEPIFIVDKDKELQAEQFNLFTKHDVVPDSLKNTSDYIIYGYIRNIALSMLNARISEMSVKPDATFTSAGVSYGNYLLSKTKDAFCVTVNPKQGKLEEAVQAVYREVLRAAQFGFTPTEYVRAQQNYISGIERQYANRAKTQNSTYVNKCVNNFLDNEPITAIQTYYDMMKQVVPMIPIDAINGEIKRMVGTSDVNTISFAFFPEKETTRYSTPESISAVINSVKGESLEAYVDNVKNEPLIKEMPKAGKIVSEKELPAFGAKVLTLSNGAKVFLKHTDFKQAEIVVKAESFGGNSLYDVKNVPSFLALNSVVNSLGLGDFSINELQKNLAGKQVFIQPFVNRTTEGFSGGSTPGDLETFMQLTYLTFASPRRDKDAFESVMSSYKASLANQETNPQAAFSDSVSATLYGHNPRIKSLKLNMIDDVNYDKICEIYEDRFKDAGDFNFIFCGNFDEDTLRVYIERYIASLPSKGRKETFAKNGVNFVKGIVNNDFKRKMETPQASAIMSWSGPIKSNIQNAVMLDIIGQLLEMDYMKKIREEASAAYSVGAWGGISRLDDCSYYIQVSCPFKPEKSELALKIIVDQLDIIAKEGVNAENLAKIKEFKLKQHAESLKTNGYWTSQLNTYALYGEDRQTGYVDAVNNVSGEMIQDFIKNHVLKDNNRTRVSMLPEE